MKRIATFPFAILSALMPAAAWAQEALPTPPEVPPPVDSSSVLDGILGMSTESMIMLVAGVALSLVSTILIRQSWANDVKLGVFFLVCLAFGVVYTLTLDNWSTTDMGRRVTLVMASGSGFYLAFKSSMQTLTTRTDGLSGRLGGK